MLDGSNGASAAGAGLAAVAASAGENGNDVMIGIATDVDKN
jgi:hypothetical protein